MMTHRHISWFTTHLAQVQEGWSESRLVQHAGAPEARSGERLIYTYTEPGLGCLLYAYFEFTVRDGVVRHVRRGGGHKLVM